MKTNLQFLKNITDIAGLQWNHKVFNVQDAGFIELALEVFRFQAVENPVYHDFIKALGIEAGQVRSLAEIPFLPISFFKSHQVKTGTFEPEKIFESSGTTGSIPSLHHVKELSFYDESFKKGFEIFYGDPRSWCIIGLLPSYLERKNSSLVYMVDKLMTWSGFPMNGFYLDEYEKLSFLLAELERRGQKVLLIGVSFALLDLAEKFPLSLKYTRVMDTGGMKGRREEIVRPELHERLKKAFDLETIHSEYGMTELLSQAYSKQEGIFFTPPWMKILLRDEEDPLQVHQQPGQRGLINIIDLANIYSCSFIATDDIGLLHEDGGIEVLGRRDGSDLRGCSLLVS